MTEDNHNTDWTPPDGWEIGRYGHTFSGRAGPFYFRKDGVAPGVGFFSEPSHGNLGNVVHGGALMTLADMALFTVAMHNEEAYRAVTVTFNAEFLAPAPIGAFITATGEVTRRGKSLVFVRGMVSAAETDSLAFSGTLKRLPPLL
ncbi:MAG: PaaI family thioesterase [Pseudomonadota bacterium]